MISYGLCSVNGVVNATVIVVMYRSLLKCLECSFCYLIVVKKNKSA